MEKLILCFVLLFLTFSVSACGDDKAAILFNRNKITDRNVMDASTVFKPGERIYYLILIPKKILTGTIDVQVIKKDNEYEKFGYNLYWSRTVPLYDDVMYYYDDYVVISEPGAYIMKVYSRDKQTKPLCMAEFYVRR